MTAVDPSMNKAFYLSPRKWHHRDGRIYDVTIKTKPNGQVVRSTQCRYCGFIYQVRGIPLHETSCVSNPDRTRGKRFDGKFNMGREMTNRRRSWVAGKPVYDFDGNLIPKPDDLGYVDRKEAGARGAATRAFNRAQGTGGTAAQRATWRRQKQQQREQRARQGAAGPTLTGGLKEQVSPSAEDTFMRAVDLLWPNGFKGHLGEFLAWADLTRELLAK